MSLDVYTQFIVEWTSIPDKFKNELITHFGGKGKDEYGEYYIPDPDDEDYPDKPDEFDLALIEAGAPKGDTILIHFDF